MNKEGKKIDNIDQLLDMAGSNLNILEEEVDVNVQKEYFSLVAELTRDPDHFQEISTTYLENINDLFDDTVDRDEKKKMLVTLATIDDVTVYRALENFSKQESPLQKWGVIALQQSRMLIQSNLLDDPGVFISTGLGGQGLLLRYFCVFFNRTTEPLQIFQQNIIKNESESAITAFNGQIEQIDFEDRYTTMLVLLPLQTDLQELFSGIIEECNQYGNFLHENMIITNVKKLTAVEILQLLENKNK